jgi:hypothetical protein
MVCIHDANAYTFGGTSTEAKQSRSVSGWSDRVGVGGETECLIVCQFVRRLTCNNGEREPWSDPCTRDPPCGNEARASASVMVSSACATAPPRRACREEVIVLSERCQQRLLTSAVALYRRWSIPLARAMAWPEFRPSLPLIREACARHDGLPGPPSGISFADDPHSAGDCQASSAHVRVAHTLSSPCDGEGQRRRRVGGRGLRHRIGPVFPMLGGLRS